MVKIKLIVVITLLILFCDSIIAQDVNVSAVTDKQSYIVGDYISYKLKVFRSKEIQVFIPPIQDSVKSLEFIRKIDPVIVEKDSITSEVYEFIFSGYDSMDVVIPRIIIEYQYRYDRTKYSTFSNAVLVKVRKMEVNPQNDIQDVKRPLKIEIDPIVIVLIVIGVILLILLAYYLYRYIKKKRSKIPLIENEIIIPPHERALKALQNLDDKKLWQKGFIKEYHSEITEIIRRYFEDRFFFNALEFTTPEILSQLKLINEAMPVLLLAESFFENADLVKFAKFKPLPTINSDMMNQAIEIVQQTKKINISSSSTEAENVQ